MIKRCAIAACLAAWAWAAAAAPPVVTVTVVRWPYT
jgi:hypothetical protein